MSLPTWVGSKKRLLPYLNQIIEQYSTENAIYVEPFLGSASVLINILEKYSDRFTRFVAYDANDALIEVFKQIKSNPANLIISLELLQNLYCSIVDMDERKEFFYRARAQFNDLRLNRTVHPNRELKMASLFLLFIFLNKTYFRGLFRVNQDGESYVD